MGKGKTEWSFSPCGITMSNKAAIEAGIPVGHSTNEQQSASMSMI